MLEMNGGQAKLSVLFSHPISASDNPVNTQETMTLIRITCLYLEILKAAIRFHGWYSRNLNTYGDFGIVL